MNRFAKFKSWFAAVLACMSMMFFSSTAFAQDAIEDGMEAGFTKITNIQDAGIPTLIMIAAGLVAAAFVIKLLRKA